MSIGALSNLNPAKDESQATINKLVNTLFETKGFKMVIVNGRTNLPTSIDDPGLSTLKQKYPSIQKDIFLYIVKKDITHESIKIYKTKQRYTY